MHFSRRHFLASLLAATALPSAALALSGPEEYIHQLGGEILKLARGGRRGDKALQGRFASLLNRYINIPNVANFALGPARAKLPEGDKAMFYGLVSNYAAALFVWYVSDFQGSELAITGSSQQGPFTLIDTKIDGTGQQLRWRVANSRVADVNVRGVWLTIAMKDMFEKTLAASNGDFKPLYAKLREADTW